MKKNCIYLLVFASTLIAINLKVIAYDNPYPTLAISNYVSTCVASNQNYPTAISSCACSIDVISKEIPYATYVELETLLRMQQVTGERTLIYKTPRSLKKLDTLHIAQIKANKECFIDRSQKVIFIQ